MDIILKRCAHCKQKKELKFFNKNKSKKDGYADYCKDCKKEENKNYYLNLDVIKHRKYSENDRNNELKRNFNINIEQYNLMLIAQNNICPICHRHKDELIKAMCVDHDHLTNEMRGLLCTKCNLRLGTFNDNIEDLKRAIIYLEKYKKQVLTTDTYFFN
jgi:hypothetical protein